MSIKNKYNPVDKSLLKQYNKIRSRNKRKKICHAPYKTLFFSQYGEIFACFYNKKEKLGIYPGNSVSDIWFGEKIRTLREYIDNNDLSYGCEDCKRYLLQKNFYSVGAWKYDYLPSSNNNFPVSIDFQISNKCNLQCIMCSGENSGLVRKNIENKTPYDNPYDESFVKQLSPFIKKLKEMSFTGGEPFIIDIYYKIWDEIIKENKEIKISVTTNGTVLNNKVKYYLEKLKFNITISLDSINKENFESIRLNSNLDEILKNMMFFREYTQKKGTVLNVKICPIRQNWKYIPELFDYLNQLNIPAIFNNVLFPPYCTLWNLSAKELGNIYTYLSGFCFKTKTPVQKDNNSRYENLLKQIENWQNKALQREKNILSDNTVELKNIFKTRLTEYIKKDKTINENDIDGKTEKILKIADKMFENITDDNKLKDALKYFIYLPVDRVVGEMEFRTIDKLKERVVQAAGYN